MFYLMNTVIECNYKGCGKASVVELRKDDNSTVGRFCKEHGLEMGGDGLVSTFIFADISELRQVLLREAEEKARAEAEVAAE